MEQTPARQYIAIDLKSFYASVECAERGLDPLGVNLVVADESRTEKTICLAVSPSLKAYGIPGRARLFEVVQKIKNINRERKRRAPGRKLTGSSYIAADLERERALAVDYIVAKPRMAHYMMVSTSIYRIYTRHIAPEDIHVYSIDEVFIDATPYLKPLNMSAKDLAMMLIREVMSETRITATAGIGTNLYLCKIAMDVVAKRMPADENGVRIAELDEMSYRRIMWDHRPLTDFWRVGRGYARKLEAHGMYTMGDVALCSIHDEDLLYGLFGVNAELLIDHAWGWEPTLISDIKAYRPESSSISSGQVLSEPYPADKARLIVQEMTDQLSLELVDKKLVTDQLVLTVCYDTDNLSAPPGERAYHGPVTTDFYGREVPKPAHGSANLSKPTSSTKHIIQAMLDLYDRIVNPGLLVRRMYVAANRLLDEDKAADYREQAPVQLDMFTDYEAEAQQAAEEQAALAREKRGQRAVLEIRKRYGKNAIVKGMNLQEGATAMERNSQIGGHHA
ncbi:MAG: DNA methylase [Clostridia bacterium]|nr:DNA methylase [Clostridia bacterium]